jgi:hypothetical protein
MMRVFKTKVFRRFQRKERMSDDSLVDAINRAEQGLVDADLGHGLIKQRIARASAGKSGGFRTIIAYRQGDRAVFLYGFAKSTKENIGADDLIDLAQTGAAVMALSQREVGQMVEDKTLFEVSDDKNDD